MNRSTKYKSTSWDFAEKRLLTFSVNRLWHGGHSRECLLWIPWVEARSQKVQLCQEYWTCMRYGMDNSIIARIKGLLGYGVSCVRAPGSEYMWNAWISLNPVHVSRRGHCPLPARVCNVQLRWVILQYQVNNRNLTWTSAPPILTSRLNRTSR